MPNTALGMNIKKEAMRLGLHRDLNLDSISGEPYTAEELERLDAFTEEIANEKILGAYYTMNEPYSDRDLPDHHSRRRCRPAGIRNGPQRTAIKAKSPQSSCKTSPI